VGEHNRSAILSADRWSSCGVPDTVNLDYIVSLKGSGDGEIAGIINPGHNLTIITRPCCGAKFGCTPDSR
jgi:hypothetical protein